MTPLVLILTTVFTFVRAEAPKPSLFVLRTIDGKTVQGTLEELSADWSLRLGGQPSAKIAGADARSLRRVGMPIPPPPGYDHLVLTNGDQMPFRTLRLDGERLVFRSALAAEAKDASVSVGFVSLIWLSPPANVDNWEAFRREFLTAKRKKDLVLLRNGDTLEGVLEAFEADRIDIEVDKKKSTVKRSQVSLVALSTDLAEKPKAKGLQARLILAGTGSRLTLSSAVCKDGKLLTATTAWGMPIQVPVEEIASIEWLSQRVIQLTDLEPKAYEFTPFLGDKAPRWPLGRDGTAQGLDLRLAGSTYDRGLSLHSRSKVTYEIPAGCERFEALVGLDERRGRLGSARVDVLVDGKSVDLGWKGDLTFAKGPMPIMAQVEHARTLTLVVDYGSRGDVQGLVNWVDTGLIKAAGKK